jgi:hypothetical protein
MAEILKISPLAESGHKIERLTWPAFSKPLRGRRNTFRINSRPPEESNEEDQNHGSDNSHNQAPDIETGHARCS